MTQAPCLLFLNQKKKKIIILFGRHLDPYLMNSRIQAQRY